MREKVGDLLLNMCSTFQSNSYENILKCIMGCCMFTPTKANEYLNHQWYDYTNIVKDGQL
jgi:enoyl reductase-like protein